MCVRIHTYICLEWMFNMLQSIICRYCKGIIFGKIFWISLAKWRWNNRWSVKVCAGFLSISFRHSIHSLFVRLYFRFIMLKCLLSRPIYILSLNNIFSAFVFVKCLVHTSPAALTQLPNNLIKTSLCYALWSYFWAECD